MSKRRAPDPPVEPEDSDDSDELDEQGQWAVGQGQQADGSLFVARVNQGATRLAGLGTFQDRVNISVDFQTANETGMPEAAESRALEQLEERLLAALEHDGSGVLVAVLTGGGGREFVFYVKDVPGLAARLAKVGRATDDYALHCHVEPDPSWRFMRQFLGESDAADA